MAKYIDADKVHESIEALQIALESNNDRIWEKNKHYYKGLAMARAVIDETPEADVVPRAEVERLQSKIKRLERYDEERDIALHARLISETKTKVAAEIFEEIERAIYKLETPYQVLHCIPTGYLTELKKKYTEAKNE